MSVDDQIEMQSPKTEVETSPSKLAMKPENDGEQVVNESDEDPDEVDYEADRLKTIK